MVLWHTWLSCWALLGCLTFLLMAKISKFLDKNFVIKYQSMALIFIKQYVTPWVRIWRQQLDGLADLRFQDNIWIRRAARLRLSLMIAKR